MDTKSGIVDSDFALFNDILEDITIKKKEDNQESFFGKNEDIPLLKHTNNDDDNNDSSENVKVQSSNCFRSFNLASEYLKLSKDSAKELRESNNSDNEIQSHTGDSGNNENSFEEQDSIDIYNENRDFDSPVDKISTDEEALIRYSSESDDHIEETDYCNSKEEYMNEKTENAPLEESDISDRGPQEPVRELAKHSDSISNIDLDNVKEIEKMEIKTVSFSMQYEKFRNVLTQLETGMGTSKVSFDIDTITKNNTLDNQVFQPKEYEKKDQLKPLKKKKMTKKKRKTFKEENRNKCYCRTCKYSVYNQPNNPPFSRMFKSASQPPTPPVPMSKNIPQRPKTAIVKSSKINRQESNFIDLEFNCSHTSSKLDANLNNTKNPVLIAWLKVKKDEEKFKKKKQLKQTKLEQTKAQQKHLKMRQRSHAATERVQDWVDRKRSQVTKTRQQKMPKDLNTSPKFSYFDEKFENSSSSDEKAEAPISKHFPTIVPSPLKRPKTSKGLKLKENASPDFSITNQSVFDISFPWNQQVVSEPEFDAWTSQKFEKYYQNIPFTNNGMCKHHAQHSFLHTWDSGFNQDGVQEELQEVAVHNGDRANNENIENIFDDIVYIDKKTEEKRNRNQATNIPKTGVCTEPYEITKTQSESDESEDHDVSSESGVDSDKENIVKEKVQVTPLYVLNILNTQIKFGTVKEFTDTIVVESVEEIEMNARLKQKRLRRPTTSIVRSPPREISLQDYQTQTTKLTEQMSQVEEMSSNSLETMINYENLLLKKNPSVNEDVTEKFETQRDCIQKIKSEREKEKAKKIFNDELEQKMLQEEKTRRFAEREASKKRVDSGRFKKTTSYNGNTIVNATSSGNFVKEKNIRHKLQSIAHDEIMYRYGRNQEINT